MKNKFVGFAVGATLSAIAIFTIAAFPDPTLTTYVGNFYGNAGGLTNVNASIFSKSGSMFAGDLGAGSTFTLPFSHNTSAGFADSVASGGPIGLSGTLTNWTFRINPPCGAGTNATLTLYTNGVASNMVITANGDGATTTFSDTSHGVKLFLATDFCAVRINWNVDPIISTRLYTWAFQQAP